MRTTPTHDAERAAARDGWSGLAARVTGLPRFVARSAASAAAFHVAFVGGVTIIKTGTNALFLSRADPSHLPLLYAAVAVVVTLATTALARLLVFRQLKQLQVEATVGGAILVLLGCAAVQLDLPGAEAGLYVIGEATATCASVLFWSRVMDGFTSRDQKKVVGLVGGGGMLGAAVGGLLVKLVVGATGVLVPMVAAAVLWVVCLPLLNAVRTRSAQASGDDKDTRKEKSAGMGEALRYLLGRGYPRAVALLVVLLAATGAASDFVFRAAAARTANEVDMAALFGLLNAVVGIVVVFLQVGLTARLLARLGVFIFAAVIPVLLLLLAVAHVVLSGLNGYGEAAFYALVTLKGVEMAGAYSLHPAVVALLYNPMPGELRAQARTLIDGAIKKSGAAAAGLVLGGLAVSGAVAGDTSVWTVFVAAAATLLLLPVLRTHYVHALTLRLQTPQTKSKKALHIDPSDKTTRKALEKGLLLDDADDVLHALEALGKHYVPGDAMLLRLIEHSDERVRTAALARVPARPDPSLAKKLLQIAQSPGARRPRAEAVRAMARVQPGRAADVVLAFLDDEEPGVVCAALEVALRSRNDKTAQQRLDVLLRDIASRHVSWRREVARLLGALQEARYTQALSSLIDDADASVRTLAVAAAYRSGDPAHVEHLVRCLDDRRTRVAVVSALVRFGDRAVPALSTALDNTALPVGVRVHVPRVLQRIGSEAAAQALLFSNPRDDAFLQARIASALAAIVAAKPGIELDKKRTDEAIGRRLIAYAAYDDALQDLSAGAAPFRLLRHVVDDRRRQNLGIAFELLGLHRGQEQMERVRRGLLDADRKDGLGQTRASFLDALELLDVALVADPLRADFLSLLDVRWEERDEEKAVERTRKLAASKDPLLRAVAKHTATRLFLDDEYVSMSGKRKAPGRDVAMPGTQELQGEDMADDLVEKLFMLEDVDLFRGLASDDLLAIAAIAGERTVEAGELLYKEGDAGEPHLYIIIDGVIELTRQGVPVLTLNSGESAGQVSFLDKGPRPVTARVSMDGDAHLLVVEREQFVDLMADRQSLMNGFLEVLAHRMRALIGRVGLVQPTDADADTVVRPKR